MHRYLIPHAKDAPQNPDAKPDYRTQSLTELNKLEQKVILLNEMLDNVDTVRQERFAVGDVYDVRGFFLVAADRSVMHVNPPFSKSRQSSSLHDQSFKSGYRTQNPTIQSL